MSQESDEYAIMLSRIAAEVEDWCEDDDSTTYEAVLAMKAELLTLRAIRIDEQLAREIAARIEMKNKTKTP